MIKIEVKYDSVEKPFEYVFKNIELNDSDLDTLKISKEIFFSSDYKDFRKELKKFRFENKMTVDSKQGYKSICHLIDDNGNSFKSVSLKV